MTCDAWREALSARIDGEETGVDPAALDAHLSRCAACRAWADVAGLVTRRVRIRPVEAVPDLVAPILAAIDAEPSGRGPSHSVSKSAGDPSTPSVVRLTLAMVAASQVLIALPAVWGNDLGASVHVAHEQAAWGLALAAAFAFGALRPARAAGLMPPLAVFVASMTALALADVAAGRTAPSGELPHLMALLGLGLLWLEAHPDVLMRHLRPGTRPPVAI